MSKHVSLGNFIHPCKKFELWFQNSKGQMSIFLSPRRIQFLGGSGLPWKILKV